MKIIIADDDKPTQLILRKVLEKASYTVETYDNGKDAYEALLKPDSSNIAILDWMMPELNGTQVIRKLAEKHILQTKYILILSSKNSSPDVAEGLLAGASDYLRKPINSFELLARIKVAERIISYQRNMRLYAKKMESLVRRNKFLNTLSTRELLLYSGDENKLPEKDNPHTRNPVIKSNGLLKILSKLINSTFKHYGFDDSLTTTGIVNPLNARKSHYTTWIALFVPELHRWIDLGFSVEIKEAIAITNHMIQSNDPSEQEIIDTLSEMTHIIVSTFKQVLSKSKNTNVYMPYISRCFMTNSLDELENQSSVESIEIKLGDVQLKAYLADMRTYDSLRNVFNIKKGDLITEEIRSKKDEDDVLIENCSIFNDGILENIQFWLKSNLINDNFRITEPSKISEYALSMSEEL